MEGTETYLQSSPQGSSEADLEVQEPQEPMVDPVVGIMDPDDTLELLRDALRQGMDAPEALDPTERTNITAHSALEPFSYDVHVKLGMELMALRRQEANIRLDAEQFGEQLKRRAYVRDMLKRVAKEDNWVQYPASDLQRISRALDRSTSKAPEKEDQEGKKPDRRQTHYSRWLERRSKVGTRRTAFGTTLVPTTKRQSMAVAPGAVAPADGAAPGTANETVAGGDPANPVFTTFGAAPRLMGPLTSAGPSRRSMDLTGIPLTSYRSSDVTRIRIQSRGVMKGGLLSAGGRRHDIEEYDEEDEDDDDDDGASQATGGGHGPFGEANGFAVRFQSDADDDDDDNARAELEDAAELLGMGGGKEGRRGDRRLGGDAASVGSRLDSADPGDRGSRRMGWRAALRKNRPAAAATVAAAPGGDAADGEEDPDADENPLLALRLSVRRELSYTAAEGQYLSAAAAALVRGESAPTREQAAAAAAAAEAAAPDMLSRLGALEEAVKSIESIGEDQLQAFIRGMEASAAAAVADSAAAPADGAAAAALEQVESWAAEASHRLDAAREQYSVVHAAKLDSITAVSDAALQLQLLRDWMAAKEQKRLAAATAALAAAKARLEGAVGGGRWPALACLLDKVEAAEEELDGLATAVEAAAGDAAAALEEKEQRRAALKLIEDECVRLAEGMAAREETDRLAALMAAEAEAERRMAEAKDDTEARKHALVAAMLMGQEEWVLEKEARLAALRAAERDEKRLSMLRVAEEEKARGAAAAGKSYDRSLLQELVELEQAARREAEVRRERLEEALLELAQFEDMIRRQQLQQQQQQEEVGKDGEEGKAENPATAANAADVAAAEADASPEELLRVAVAAVRQCCSMVAAEAEVEAGQQGDGGDAAAAAATEGEEEGQAAEGEEGGPQESALDRTIREAQTRLAAARAGLEALAAARRAPSLGGAVMAAAVAEADANAASATAAAEPPSPPSPQPSRRGLFIRGLSLTHRDAASLRTAQQELQEEQSRLASLAAAAGGMLKGRSRLLLKSVMEECSSLAAAVEAVAVEVVEAAAVAEASIAPSDSEAADSLPTSPDQPPSASGTDSTAAAAAAAAAAAVAVTVTAVPQSPAMTAAEPRALPSSSAATAAVPPAAAPPAQPLLPAPQPVNALQPSLMALQLPPPTSPHGALAPPVVRTRASAPGVAPLNVPLGLSPRSDSPGADWALRAEPMATTSGHPGGGGGGSIASSVLLGSGPALAPPPLPAVHPHHLHSGARAAAAAGGAGGAVGGGLSRSHVQHHPNPNLHPPPHHHAGIVAPYGKAHPHPHPQQQVVLPVVVTPSSSDGASSSRRAPANGTRGGPGPGGLGAAVAPDFLPPISASHSPTGTGAGAPPPTPREGTTDGAPPVGTITPRLAAPPPPPPPPPQQQPQSTTLWAGAATGPRHTRSFPASPEPVSRASPASSTTTPTRGGASSGNGGRAAAETAPGGRQAVPYNNNHQQNVLSAPLSAPGNHAYDSQGHGGGRRKDPGRDDPAAAAAGAAGGSGGGASPLRGSSQHALSAGVGQRAAAQPSTVLMGDMTYSQWASAQQNMTPRALEAARLVDQVLSRVPPELHSVLLNAAELLTLDKGGFETVQLQPLVAAAPLAGADSGGGGGGTFVPAHLQSLPPVVSRYIHAQLQRLFNNSLNYGTKPGASGGGVADGGGGLAAESSSSSSHGLGLGSDQSLAALELLNQLLPAIAQSVAQVRTRMGPGGGAAAVPAGAAAAAAPPPPSLSPEASRCPIGTGAMQGSPLRSSRRARSMPLEGSDGGSNGGGSSGASSTSAAPAPAPAAGPPAAAGPAGAQGPRVRHHTLSLSTQTAHHGAVGKAGGGAGGGQRRGLTGGAGGKTGRGGGSSGDLRRRESTELEKWMVRGVNMQPGAKSPGHQQPPPPQQHPQHPHHPQQQPDGQGAPGGHGAMAVAVSGVGRAVAPPPQPREAFLPPLGHKMAAVRH